jgi:Rod binding domain-containing protein
MEGLSLDPRMLYNNVKMKMEKSAPGSASFDQVLQAKMDKTQKKSELRKACTAMESLFIDQMLKVMRKSVNKNEFLNGGFAEEVFSDMLYTEYSQKMAESGHFGVAKMLYQSMERYL